MNYRLAVLTHGRHDERPAVEAFLAHASPEPAVVDVFRDAAPQRGFCQATARLWAISAAGAEDYVFWLEQDFRLCRAVDLRELAAVLDETNRPLTDLERPIYGWAEYRHGRLAQIALLRDAYSDEEKAAGGLFELRRDDFTPMTGYRDDFDIDDGMGAEYVQWLRMPWFTTNPSLMRRDFMAAHPFEPDEPHCEGKFGISLAEEGFEFGTWGSGEVFCRHVGARDGFGY